MTTTAKMITDAAQFLTAAVSEAQFKWDRAADFKKLSVDVLSNNDRAVVVYLNSEEYGQMIAVAVKKFDTAADAAAFAASAAALLAVLVATGATRPVYQGAQA